MISLYVLLSTTQAQIPLNTLHRISSSEESSSDLQGSIPIDSSSYKVLCKCSDDKTPSSLKCNPTKIKLTEDRSSNSLLYDSLSSILTHHNFSYMNSWGQSFRCMDGRDKTSGISTPGGDLGEFILALIVYQDMVGCSLDDQTTKSYFLEWLQVMDSEFFYVCTDEEAVSHLRKQVGEFSFEKPRFEMIDDLLHIVANSRNVGDSHLRFMLEYPQMYSIRPSVVQSAIRAVFDVFWKKEKGLDRLIQVDVLTGEHKEKAYLEVRVSEDCQYEGASPILPKPLDLFINFIDAVSPRRKQLAEFFAVKIGKNQNGLTSEKLFKRMNHHGLLFLDITGSLLVKDLPFYTALFV